MAEVERGLRGYEEGERRGSYPPPSLWCHKRMVRAKGAVEARLRWVRERPDEGGLQYGCSTAREKAKDKL